MKKEVGKHIESPKTRISLKHRTKRFCATTEYVVFRLGLLVLFFYEVIATVEGKLHFFDWLTKFLLVTSF